MLSYHNIGVVSEQASTVDVPYGKKDMCDTDAQQPAGLHGWFNPPSVHTAILSGLEPETQYFYR